MTASSRKRQRLSTSNSKESAKKDPTPGPPPIARRQQQQQQHSPLLRLPHELLVIIADDIVVHDKPLMLHSKERFQKKATVGSRSPLLSVLLACRALYFAGIEVFYGRNTLRFQHAVHLRKFLSGLNYDQRWCICAFELNVEWVKRRTNAQAWHPLNEIDDCSQWKDVIEQLPKLRCIVIRSLTKFGELEMSTGANTGAFETRMREEMGNDKSEWPSTIADMSSAFVFPGSIEDSAITVIMDVTLALMDDKEI